MNSIKVINSKEAAIKSGKWKNPGAVLYDKLLDSFYCVGSLPDSTKELDEKIKNGEMQYGDALLKEAYLIAPVSQIKNSPYGRTPFCRSGCKYPHHVLRGGELVLSVPGVKAAYARACQQGDFKGEVKEHLLRHIKELSLDTYDTKEGTMAIGEEVSVTRRIDENFDDISSFLLERTGINLFDTDNGRIPDSKGSKYPAVIAETKNPNDPESQEAVDITFFNQDGIKVGTASVSAIDTNNSFMYNVEVDKAYRGNGYGSAIINYCISNYDVKELTVAVNNSDAIRLYEKFGFRKTRDWEENGRKLIVMRRSVPKFHNHTTPNDLIDEYLEKLVFPNPRGMWLPIIMMWNNQQLGGGTITMYQLASKAREITSESIQGYINRHPDILEGDGRVDLEQLKDELQNLGYGGSTSIIEESMQWIDSFVNDDTFRESIESSMNDIITKCKTPSELLSWMDCIEYGWIDKSGNVQGTGDDDDEEDFFNEYRLQSPDQLIRSKVGVCWDQAELERKWFKTHGFEYNVYYIEIQNGDTCPTHTFLIYRYHEPGDSETYFHYFEHSWGSYKGIHEYGSLKKCLTDIIARHRQANNDMESPVLITRMDSVPSAGCTCDQYMTLARNSPSIDLADLSSKDLLEETYDPPLSYDKLPAHLKNDEIHAWRARTGIELIHQEPTLEELNRIWANWNQMTDNQKVISNKKSMELFGMTNEQHYKKLLSVYLHQEYTLETLPNELYFSSPKKLTELKGKVFMSPFAGISSIFIVDRFNIFLECVTEFLGHTPNKFGYNIGYEEWGMEEADLILPLKEIHMNHNVPEFTKRYTGQSSGYIYKVDISEVRDKLAPHGNHSLNREVIYTGNKPLKILEITPHTINWSLEYSEENMEHSGRGIVESGDIFDPEGPHWSSRVFIESGDEDDQIENQSTEDDCITERSHGKLKYDFRFGWDYNTGHQIKIVYSLDGIDVTDVGDFFWKYNPQNKNPDGSLKMDKAQYLKHVQSTISKEGNNDHRSSGQKVLAIVDVVTNENIPSVQLMSPISLDDSDKKYTRYTTIPSDILEDARKLARGKNGVSLIKVGEEDQSSSFKATSWLKGVIDKKTGENLRFNKLAKAEFIKIARGIKPNDIQASDTELLDDPDSRPLIYNNPNKKEALTELYVLERNAKYWIRIFNYAINNDKYPAGWDYRNTLNELMRETRKLKYIQDDISTIQSGHYNLAMMNKYKEAASIEATLESRDQYLKEHPDSDIVPPISSIPYYDIPFKEDDIFTEEIEIKSESDDSSDDPPALDEDSDTPKENDQADDPMPELSDEPIEEPSQDEQSDETPAEEPTEDPAPEEDSKPEPEKESMPKQTDKAESDKNGVRRKKLYIAFIEWCKEYNIKNTFGSIFDKDAFKVSYPFVPDEMRYFYRLANPMLCVLAGDLTFFPVAELTKINKNNKKLNEMMIFAGTPTELRVFNRKNKKVYRGTDEKGEIVLHEELGDTFDTYIQNMIKKGDILNGPIEESVDFQDLTVTES